MAAIPTSTWKKYFTQIDSNDQNSPYVYVPKNASSDTPVIFFAPGWSGTGSTPTYGGYRNESETGELVNYISNHPLMTYHFLKNESSQ